MLTRSLIFLLCLSTPALSAELIEKRSPAPKFKLDTIKGERYKLSSDKGKVVVVSFWATWCKPCLQELSFLKKLAKKHPETLTVLAVSTDDANTISNVRKVAKRKRLTMPVLLDQDGSVMGVFNPRASLPFSAYIDHTGRVAATHSGFSSGDEEGIEKVVLALLEERKAATTAAQKAETDTQPESPATAQPAPATPTEAPTGSDAAAPTVEKQAVPTPVPPSDGETVNPNK